MKGIRKLFLGLIFLALFGVGFKVEAKAAPNATLDLSGGAFSNPDNKLTGKFKFNTVPTVASGEGEVTFHYDIYLIDINHENAKVDMRPSFPYPCTVDLTLKKEGSGVPAVTLKINGTDAGNPSNNFYDVFSVDREVIRKALSNYQADNGVVEGKYAVTAKLTRIPETGGGLDISNPPTEDPENSSQVIISAGVVDGGAYIDTTKLAGLKYGDGKERALLMFPEEKQQFYLDTLIATNYKFIEWENTGTGTLTSPTSDSVYLEKAATAKDDFIVARYGQVTFDPETAVIEPGGSQAVTLILSEYTIDEVLTPQKGSFPGTVTVDKVNKKLIIDVPKSATEKDYTINVPMKGGGIFEYKFTVNNSSLTLADEIKVTEKEKIALSKYVVDASSSTMSVNAKATSTAASHVSVLDSAGKSIATSAALNKIYIHGKSATSKTGVQAFTVTSATNTNVTDTTGVTVYPRPSISLNSSDSSSGSLNSSTSSSSSSADSPFKVTMPTGVYHDDVAYDTVKKAKIKFHRSDKDDKYATLDLGSSSSSSSLTKSASANSLAVTDILNDLCGDDSSYTIKLTAYPMDGDSDRYDEDVYATEEFTAYKITLDGSGGAKYTVNGREMSGQFYAVKGTTYTIKSSSANGGKFEKWDDSVFSSESGGSYKVLGAKTLKANYTSTTPTPTPTPTVTPVPGNMDDYDDVPKTGESKADIWILWTVLFIAILGAGFMIWKRFGLVRAIAAADAEVAIAEEEERIETEKKEKEDKLNMLKDLRNL